MCLIFCLFKFLQPFGNTFTSHLLRAVVDLNCSFLNGTRQILIYTQFPLI